MKSLSWFTHRAPAVRALAVAGLVFVAGATSVHADAFLDRANSGYSSVPQARRSDLVLLPILAKMQPPPAPVATVEQAGMLPADASGWAEARAWAMAPSQRAALEALAKVTVENDWRIAFVFAQPYGTDGVTTDLIRARMYTELGDPPTLAAAQHLYMPSLDALMCLVNVEATRLLAEGNAADGIDVLINACFFSRQMCDRAFFREASWGIRHMALCQERIRDVAYTDWKQGKSIQKDTARLLKQIKRLQEEDGYLDLSRMKFPTADRVAGEQILARVYPDERGGVDERIFAPTMARLGSTAFPLRLFSESAKWRAAASEQADAVTAKRKGSSIFDDWTVRWGFSAFDSRLGNVSEYDSLDRSKYAVIAQAVPDASSLMPMRQVAMTEGVGTRLSLAHLGYLYVQKNLAPTVTAVRPFWMSKMEADPFNPNRANAAVPPLEYFVPIRDQPRAANQDPTPHEVDIVTADPFDVRLVDDMFVIYSYGSDQAKGFCRRVQNTARKTEIAADYLIWPPVQSLYRKHLRDKQVIK